MFAPVVLAQNVLRQVRRMRIELKSAQRHLAANFQRNAVLHRVDRALAPGEGRVKALQRRRHFRGIEPFFPETLDDGAAGVGFVVLLHLGFGQFPHQRHRSVKMIGMRGAQARQLPPRLAKHDRVDAVGVRNAANFGKFAVKDAMRRRIGGGVEFALHDVSLQIDDRQIFGAKLVVGDSARLDDEQPGIAVDAANVAPRQPDQSFGLEHEVGLQHFLAQILEHHGRTFEVRIRRLSTRADLFPTCHNFRLIDFPDIGTKVRAVPENLESSFFPMSFERSEFQDPPHAANRGSRKLATVLIPLVAAVPVTIALVARNRGDDGPSAAELNAMLGAAESAEEQQAAATADEPPEDLASVSGLPPGGAKEAPPGPVDPATAGVAESAETAEKPAVAVVSEPEPKAVKSSLLEASGDGIGSPAAANPVPTSHAVQPGDTLYGIGQKYGLKPEEIAKSNEISVTDPIQPGQVLVIPQRGQVGSSESGIAGVPGPQPAPKSSEPVSPGANVGADVVGPTEPREIPYENLPSGGVGGVPESPATNSQTAIIPASRQSANRTTETAGGYFPATGGSTSTTPAAEGPTSAAAPSVGPRYCIGYVVHRGDSLDSIAFSHSTTVSVIQAMNGVSRVSPGQVIVVPVDGIMTPCQ